MGLFRRKKKSKEECRILQELMMGHLGIPTRNCEDCGITERLTGRGLFYGSNTICLECRCERLESAADAKRTEDRIWMSNTGKAISNLITEIYHIKEEMQAKTKKKPVKKMVKK